jgi:hypothetical protein
MVAVRTDDVDHDVIRENIGVESFILIEDPEFLGRA